MKSLAERWADEARMLDDWYAMKEKKKAWKNPISCMYQRACEFAKQRDYESMRSEIQAIYAMTDKKMSEILHEFTVMQLPSIFFNNKLYCPKSRADEIKTIGRMHGYVGIPSLPNLQWNALQIDTYMKNYVSGEEEAERDKHLGFNIYEDECDSIIEDLTNDHKVEPEVKNAK
jgi:hypothetical protein